MTRKDLILNQWARCRTRDPKNLRHNAQILAELDHDFPEMGADQGDALSRDFFLMWVNVPEIRQHPNRWKLMVSAIAIGRACRLDPMPYGYGVIVKDIGMKPLEVQILRALLKAPIVTGEVPFEYQKSSESIFLRAGEFWGLACPNLRLCR